MSNQKLDHLLEDTYSIVDDIFRVFESVKGMFKQWDRSKHMPFIQEVMRLQQLEVELYRLNYTEEFVGLLVKCVYESVFSTPERNQYAGNWHILA